MRKLRSQIFGLAAFVALALAFSACSDRDVEPRGVVLDCLGPDYDFFVLANPTALAQSADNEVIERLHSSDSEIFTLIAGLEGVDKQNVLAVAYSHPAQSAMVFAVTNSGKLSHSLEQAGWTSTHTDEGTAFTREGRAHNLLCDNSALWLVRAPSAAETAAAVAALKARAGALPAWLQKRLADVASQPLAACYTLPDSTHLFGWLNIDGPKADGRLFRIDTDGLRITLVNAKNRRPGGNVFEAYKPTEALSAMVALPKNTDLASWIERATRGAYLPREIADAAGALDGRFAFTVSTKSPVADVMDFSNYTFAVALGTQPGKAQSVLADLCSGAATFGVPVWGSGVSFAGQELMKGSAPQSDLVLVSSPGFLPSGAAPTEDIALLNVNLPAGSPFTQMLGLDCGLSARVRVCAEEASFSVDFAGSQKGFIANILQVADIF